jgi:hypothetical protein
MVELSPLRQLRLGQLPKMVSWYDPRLLARIGVRTIISSVFGQYADQRLIQAVTDPCNDDKDLCSRYDYSDPNATEPDRRIVADETGAFWLDYIADVGDGFESSYAMAYLLAQDSLDVRQAGRLRHGEVLIMGGDQCYPQATREEYKKRLLTPFNWAFTVKNPDRKLFAIPGNHDWYDGLASFDSLFCSSRDRSSKGNVIGGWQCQQHRSYWAIRMPYNWWIWGADIQFSKYLDASQVSYFETVAAQMGPQDNLIVCLAEPSWLLADSTGEDEEENFFKITTIARKHGVRICAVIAGDWHHYARYFAHELDIHFITSGGGGAFLHPTHVLKNAISVRWPERPDEEETEAPDTTGVRPGEGWKPKQYDIHLKRNTKVAEGVVDQAVQDVKDALAPLQGPATLSPKRKRQPLKPQAPKCYPEKSKSYLISLGNVLFPFYNPGFAIGLGLLYWLITWEFQTLVTRHDISSGKIDNLGITTSLGEVLAFMPLYLIQAMISSIALVAMLGGLYAALVWYVDAVDYPGPRRYLTKFFVGTGHFLAHLTAMFTLSLFIVMLNNWMTPSIERAVDAIYSARKEQTQIVQDVIEESLKPLQRRTEAQQSTPAPEGQKRQKPVREIVGFMSYPTLMIGLGALVGGSLWGFYWVLTGLFRMHSGEAFAALRIKNYKHFLRIKIEKDKLTIYPLAVDKVPGPDHWMNAPKGKANPLPNNPKLIAVKPIDVRLIENPIVITSYDETYE